MKNGPIVEPGLNIVHDVFNRDRSLLPIELHFDISHGSLEDYDGIYTLDL